MITIRCTRSRGPRGFFCLHDVCRGPVNVAVIPLKTKVRDLSTMSVWILISSILLFWLSYPVFGAIGVSASIARGDSPDDAGFSFLPELIVFPPIFFAIAAAIDYVVMPWGRLIVSGLCLLLFAWGVIASIRSVILIRRANNAG